MLDLLARDAHGARVLRVLSDPAGDAHRGGRRAPRIDGPIPGAAITADALVELASGRVPQRVDVVTALPPRDAVDELRRRARGQVRPRERHGVIDVRAPASEAQPFHVRVLPDEDPVLRLRGGRLYLDGRLDDPSGDLLAHRVALTAPGALEHHPEALLHVARLAVRPGFELDDAALEAAIELRRRGAPQNVPLSRLGFSMEDLLAAPELPEAVVWLHGLAPELPLADGVVADAGALRAAVSSGGPDRLDAILRALAPGATTRTRRAFIAGAHLDDR